jgi:xylan 1,4-beta-xylosidase
MTTDAIIADGLRDKPDVDAMATVDGTGAAIMLWNYHDAENGGADAAVNITVRGLPKNAARVRLLHYRIDNSHSNAYTAWKAMGSPQNPTTAQLAALRDKEGLQLLESPRWLTAQGGAVTITTGMPRQSVSLLQLEWQP